MPRLLLILLASLTLSLSPAHAQKSKKAKKAEAEAPPAAAYFDEELAKGMEWRLVGPYRGGRSAAVAGIPGDTETYYFGGTGGGVWKTTDAGRSWNNVSDGYFGGSIGAVAVSEWDHNVVYVGGGEKTVRGNVSHGTGMWKSVDAGKTWKSIGLTDSRHISRIRIHPRDPNLVYVAVMGHLFGPNEERGLYRSKDGGETWEQIHFISNEVGAVDLAMDPTNPRVLYASFWRVLRTPWTLESGGEGSSLWKSTDSGETWEDISTNAGLPAGPLGIIGITVSPSNPNNLYAIVEAEKGGVFRSRDGGETWRNTNTERSLRQRAWYYTRIYADTQDEETVYVLNVQFHRSTNGGRSFTQIAVPHGDNHDLWIAPEDPMRMVQSNDGGANVSKDGGQTWTAQDTQPTAQMYRVSTDNDFPYRLLGGQQDNSAIRIRSRSASGGAIDLRQWESTAGCESGHVVAKPDNPDIVYGGCYGGQLFRVDHSKSSLRMIDVWPDDPMGWGAAELTYRFNWNFPLFFSPHDPDLLYTAGNVLFKSNDGGGSWEAISPDLTKNDKETMGPSGGPITKDNTSVEYFGTIFAALESPHEAGVLWAASDDGLIHVSKDGGGNWENVTPPDLPEWMMFNSIEAHPTEKGGLYAAGTRYKSNDFKPYLYKTTDYGATWTKITNGIADDHFTRVIRADPDRPGLLYAGTELGVYVSFDDGASWQTMQLNLPIVPITDLAVKEGDLVAATQGRSYWILDDLSPLHQWDGAPEGEHLFAPRPAHRIPGGRGFFRGPRNAGQSPPAGVTFAYFISEEVADDPKTKIQLEILDKDGEEIRTYTRRPAAGTERPRGRGMGENLSRLPAEKGLNRFTWDFSYPPAENFPGMILWNGSMRGPRAVPGEYKARLTVGDWSGETDVTVVPDPRAESSPADYQAQFEFHMSCRDKLTEMHTELGNVRELKSQIDALAKRTKGHDGAKEIKEAGEALKEKLEEVEKALYQTKNQSRQDPLNFPIRLNDKLANVMGMAAAGDYPPTRQLIAVRDELFGKIDAELAKLATIHAEDVPAFNALVAEKAVPALSLPSDEDEAEEDEEQGEETEH